MSINLNPLLLTVLSPLLGFALILFINKESKNAIRWVALCTSFVTFLVSLLLVGKFNNGNPGFQHEVDQVWFAIAGIPVGFHIGVDGLNILLILLTTFLTPISILSTWSAIDEQVKGFMLFFLLLEVGMLGVFVSIDLVLFYVFWEFTLVPMYFLIGVWGGKRLSLIHI